MWTPNVEEEMMQGEMSTYVQKEEPEDGETAGIKESSVLWLQQEPLSSQWPAALAGMWEWRL